MHLLDFLDTRGVRAELVQAFADELEYHIVIFLNRLLKRVYQGV
jgi:hypothetical protein